MDNQSFTENSEDINKKIKESLKEIDSNKTVLDDLSSNSQSEDEESDEENDEENDEER